MKKIRISLPQRDAGSMAQGCAKRLGLLVLGIVAALALLGPSRAAADQSSPITHLQFLQVLVQMSGDTPKFSASSTAADYVQWARNKGMVNVPWQPGAHLTRDVLNRSLVQLFGLTPGKLGADYARILAREGINVGSDPEPTRADIVTLVDGLGLQHRPMKHPSPKKCPPGHGEDEPGDENHDCGLGEGHDKHPGLSNHEDNRGDDRHQGKNRD
jgi:hypothetical protein